MRTAILLISTAFLTLSGCGAIKGAFKNDKKKKEAEKVAAENKSIEEHRAELEARIQGLEDRIKVLETNNSPDRTSDGQDRDAELEAQIKELADKIAALRLEKDGLPVTGTLIQKESENLAQPGFYTVMDGIINYQIHADGTFAYAGSFREFPNSSFRAYFAKTYNMGAERVLGTFYDAEGKAFFLDKADIRVDRLEQGKRALIKIDQKEQEEGQYSPMRLTDSESDLDIDLTGTKIDINNIVSRLYFTTGTALRVRFEKLR